MSVNGKIGKSGGKIMADITKCQGRNCERKETCYRYTAQADDWQSWSDFDQLEDCEYYWKIESEGKQQ